MATMFEPGHCSILNNNPSVIIESDIAPEVNANNFIIVSINNPNYLAFRFAPFNYGLWTPFNFLILS